MEHHVEPAFVEDSLVRQGNRSQVAELVLLDLAVGQFYLRFLDGWVSGVEGVDELPGVFAFAEFDHDDLLDEPTPESLGDEGHEGLGQVVLFLLGEDVVKLPPFEGKQERESWLFNF